MNQRTKSQFVSFDNGILSLDKLFADDDEPLIPHTPRFFSNTVLPYPYLPEAECPTWERTLQQNLEGDRLERYHLLQEWAGYLLSGDTSLQKFLMLEGEGRNGKSVFLAGITALLGCENVSHVSLEEFSDNFSMIEMHGKLANIAPDMSEVDTAAEGKLKAFTSGDTMSFQRKYKSAIQAIPTARLMFATNVRPRFKDRSKGLWRRMLLVPFKREVSDDEVIHGMDSPTWWEQSGEMPGIAWWALAGLARLRQNGRFTIPALMTTAIDEYQRETNSARAFLLDRYEERACEFIVKMEAYRHYQEWCTANGHKAMSQTLFRKEVLRVFPSSVERRKRLIGERPYVFEGIAEQSEF